MIEQGIINRNKPTDVQLMDIALKGSISLSTVRRVYKGGGHKNSRDRVAQTAKRLGLPMPEVK